MYRLADKIMIAVVVIGLSGLIGVAFYCDGVTKEKVTVDAAKCDAAGGVYLDRTYSYGKNSTGHLYTCVWKDLIIKEY